MTLDVILYLIYSICNIQISLLNIEVIHELKGANEMMEYEVVTLPEKMIVGVSEVTGNQDPKMGEIIGELWNQLYQGGLYQRIQNKKTPYSIGLYSDYTEDKYCVTVGCEAEQAGNESLSMKRLPAGKYAKFAVHGNVVTAVQDAWTEIWKMDLPRSYTGDYEEYVSSEMEQADINIYIALM